MGCHMKSNLAEVAEPEQLIAMADAYGAAADALIRAHTQDEVFCTRCGARFHDLPERCRDETFTCPGWHRVLAIVKRVAN